MKRDQIHGQMKILRRFVAVYCRAHHGAGEVPCPQCSELIDYARARLEKCPFDPKPKCKNCRVHCYDAEHRERMKKVMRFSGTHFVKRGRVDWLVKYFLVR